MTSILQMCLYEKSILHEIITVKSNLREHLCVRSFMINSHIITNHHANLCPYTTLTMMTMARRTMTLMTIPTAPQATKSATMATARNCRRLRCTGVYAIVTIVLLYS